MIYLLFCVCFSFNQYFRLDTKERWERKSNMWKYHWGRQNVEMLVRGFYLLELQRQPWNPLSWSRPYVLLLKGLRAVDMKGKICQKVRWDFALVSSYACERGGFAGLRRPWCCPWLTNSLALCRGLSCFVRGISPCPHYIDPIYDVNFKLTWLNLFQCPSIFFYFVMKLYYYIILMMQVKKMLIHHGLKTLFQKVSQ